LLAIDAALIGWCLGGLVGAVYGFLFSRIGCLAQDLYTIRLIRGGGWLDPGTWRKVAGQGPVAAVFAPICLLVKHTSYWLLLPAALHGGLVAAWLLRQPLRKLLR
jgi:hypothetical protein